jgi:hypothetical protein
MVAWLAQVEEWLGNVKQTLRYRTGGEALIDRMREIWLNDFEVTSASIRADAGRFKRRADIDNLGPGGLDKKLIVWPFGKQELDLHFVS